jgi:hypothetical protein
VQCRIRPRPIFLPFVLHSNLSRESGRNWLELVHVQVWRYIEHVEVTESSVFDTDSGPYRSYSRPFSRRCATSVVRVTARTIVSISLLNFNCDRGSSHPSNLSQNYMCSCLVTAPWHIFPLPHALWSERTDLYRFSSDDRRQLILSDNRCTPRSPLCKFRPHARSTPSANTLGPTSLPALTPPPRCWFKDTC